MINYNNSGLNVFTRDKSISLNGKYLRIEIKTQTEYKMSGNIYFALNYFVRNSILNVIGLMLIFITYLERF